MHAITDVTGFGLGGHSAGNLSRLEARLHGRVRQAAADRRGGDASEGRHRHRRLGAQLGELRRGGRTARRTSPNGSRRWSPIRRPAAACWWPVRRTTSMPCWRPSAPTASIGGGHRSTYGAGVRRVATADFHLSKGLQRRPDVVEDLRLRRRGRMQAVGLEGRASAASGSSRKGSSAHVFRLGDEAKELLEFGGRSRRHSSAAASCRPAARGASRLGRPDHRDQVLAHLRAPAGRAGRRWRRAR